MNQITGKAKLAGVIGWPVAHSRSPLIHNFWLERYKIDGVYIPLPVKGENFEILIRGMMAAGFRGCNVTIPHKERAFQICDVLDPNAQHIRSVNTLMFRDDGSIYGTSTDGDGFIASLEAQNVNLEKGSALILGAGGAARSVVVALVQRNVSVFIANRTYERAVELAKAYDLAQAIKWHEWPKHLENITLLVNATSLGMEGANSCDFDLTHASKDMVVSDIVYVPRETPLLKAARQRGLKTVEGLGMLLHQARFGFSQWFGVDPVVDQEITELLANSLKS
ncbi:MAG: shikimate dehydrogenase [Commensalibacter sp.]